jgi:hypothetical protein
LVVQGSQIFTGYLTDQLQHESKLEQDLTDGKISQFELEIRNNQWEEVEWDKRLQSLPGKIRTALVKYHVLMLLMRFYEKVIGIMAERALMEKLTKDAFKSAVRESRKIDAGERKADGYAKEMFDTCLYSNMISFMADYSIQQGFLAYGYYLYIRNAKKEKKFDVFKSKEDLHSLSLDYELNDGVEDDLFVDPNQDNIVASGDGGDGDGGDGDSDGDEPGEKPTKHDSSALSSFNPDKSGSGGIIFSFVYKSSNLIITRAIGLFMASIGGAFGSTIRPGWGTLFGVQIGDAIASTLLDD